MWSQRRKRYRQRRTSACVGASDTTSLLARDAGGLCLRMKDQFLHSPVGGLRRVHLVFRRAGQLVSAGKLPKVASGASNDPEHLAFQRDLEDAAGEGAFSDE